MQNYEMAAGKHKQNYVKSVFQNLHNDLTIQNEVYADALSTSVRVLDEKNNRLIKYE